jgi:hypothetical protein
MLTSLQGLARALRTSNGLTTSCNNSLRRVLSIFLTERYDPESQKQYCRNFCLDRTLLELLDRTEKLRGTNKISIKLSDQPRCLINIIRRRAQKKHQLETHGIYPFRCQHFVWSGIPTPTLADETPDKVPTILAALSLVSTLMLVGFPNYPMREVVLEADTVRKTSRLGVMSKSWGWKFVRRLSVTNW